MALGITSVDGNTVNGATSYAVEIRSSTRIKRSATTALSPRRQGFPVFDSMTSDAFDLLVTITPTNASTAYATWISNVEQWFDPYKGAEIPLTATWHDGTAVQASALVVSREQLRDAGTVGKGHIKYEAVLRFPFGRWEAASVTTDSSSPVANAGNANAYPVLALTTTADKTWLRFTVVAAGNGGGLSRTPVRFLLGDANATTTTTLVFINGRLVPSYVDDGGLSTSNVFALVDTHPDGVTATTVDIIFGSGLVNPLSQTLPTGGLDYASITLNTVWKWTDFRVSRFSDHAGALRPGLTGNHNGAANSSFGLTSEAAAQVAIRIATAGVLTNDADSVVFWVSTQAGTSNALINCNRVLTSFDGTNAQAYVRYRLAGSRAWIDAWTSRTDGTVSTAIDMDNAVEVAMGVENDGATADPCTFNVGFTGSSMQLTLINTPTVTNTVTGVMNYYNGTFTVGSYTLTLNDVLVPDGTFTIHVRNRTYSTQGDGPLYAASDDPPIQWSDRDQWLPLVPGNNTVTNSVASASWSMDYRSAFT